MRHEYKATHVGDVRTRTAFLWFPKTIYDEKRDMIETRWLERAAWEEEYTADWAMPPGWRATRWL